MELADIIKSTIEAKTCTIHDVHPVLDVTGAEITIACCCAKFHWECATEVRALYANNPVFPYSVSA